MDKYLTTWFILGLIACVISICYNIRPPITIQHLVMIIAHCAVLLFFGPITLGLIFGMNVWPRIKNYVIYQGSDPNRKPQEGSSGFINLDGSI